MTLAREWPDYEAEEKAAKKKAKKKQDNFIETDSEDEPRKKIQERMLLRYLLHLSNLIIHTAGLLFQMEVSR